MATDPPELDPPTTRSRLVETFGSMDSWGEHGPAAMQALLDAVDTETVPAVDSLDDLENIEETQLPYVLKGSDRSPGDIPPQMVPTGREFNTLSETLSNQVSSVENSKLNSVDTVADISEPADEERFYVASLGATVQSHGSSDTFQLESIPVVETADALADHDTSDIPYVTTDTTSPPAEMSDQAVSTGADLKAVLDSVTSEIDSVTNAKLNSVKSISDISEPADEERFYVVNLETTVKYDASQDKYAIEGVGKVDGTSASDLPSSTLFTSGSRIETRGNGETWRVES